MIRIKQKETKILCDKNQHIYLEQKVLIKNCFIFYLKIMKKINYFKKIKITKKFIIKYKFYKNKFN
jgi:hypothetical protein